MQMMEAGSIAIIPASPIRLRNRDVEYPYRPDSDFYYLTGFAEPNAVAVLAPGGKHGEYILFCQERDPKVEIWTGLQSGQEGAVEVYGADDSFPIDDVDDILPGMLENVDRVYYTMGTHLEFDTQLIGWVNRLRQQARAGVQTPGEFVSLDHLLHEMRLFKSSQEIKLMSKAAQISAAAHCRAMQVCKPGIKEFQLEAEFLHTFIQAGARFPAYAPIVGGGRNACVLHYTDNKDILLDGDLLLSDAGAEYDYYAADITRTFPVNGHYSESQRALYEVVLCAQQAAIKQVKPNKHWNDPHEAAVAVITEGLVELGILKGRINSLIKRGAYKRFYMHRTGHWLGMDVHDVGDYKVDGEWRQLEPGMIMTVEPGIYIPAGSKGVAKKWWDVGIRIEDDVLITKTGNKVITSAVPNDPDAIEALMASA